MPYQISFCDNERAITITHASPIMLSAVRIPAMSSLLSIAALLCFAGQVLAHEHHMDDIPEGEAVSAEPIVCLPLMESPLSCAYAGRIPHYGST